MKKNTGYREMLRDRCPKLVSYALKWCKAKEKWLDHVYNNWIWIYSSNEERYGAAKAILGIDGKKMQFNFVDTILWDNMSSEEKDYWTKVCGWVSWFQQKYAYIKNTYDILNSTGKDISTIKLRIIHDYLMLMCPTTQDSDEVKEEKNRYINSLVDYLIDCFENRI